MNAHGFLESLECFIGFHSTRKVGNHWANTGDPQVWIDSINCLLVK